MGLISVTTGQTLINTLRGISTESFKKNDNKANFYNVIANFLYAIMYTELNIYAFKWRLLLV